MFIFASAAFLPVASNIFTDFNLSEDLIVVRNNTDATFKKLIIESDERRYLQALNPNFQPNIIPLKEDAVYKGKYTGKFTPSKKFL